MQVVVKKQPNKKRSLESIVIEAFRHVDSVSDLGMYVRCRYKGSAKQDVIKRIALENGLPYLKLQKTVKSPKKEDDDNRPTDPDLHTAGGVSGKVNMFELAKNYDLVITRNGANFRADNGKLLSSISEWTPIMQQTNKIRVSKGQEQIVYVEEWRWNTVFEAVNKVNKK